MGGQIDSVQVAGLGTLTLGDYVHTVLRSTVEVGSGDTATLNFFQNAVGDTMQGNGTSTNQTLTPYDTNIPDKGKLPPGWQFLVFFLSVQPYATSTLVDLQDVQAKVLFRLILGSTDKESDSGNLSRYPQGGGLYGVSDLNAVQNWTNGLPSGGARTPYAIPHSIKELIPFRVEASIRSTLSIANGAPNPTSMWLLLNLEGIARKPVA